MKINKTVASTGILLILFYFFCANFNEVISLFSTFIVAIAPIIWSAAIILLVNSIEKTICKNVKNEKIAATISITIFIAIILVVLLMIIPQLISSSTQLIHLLNNYEFSQIFKNLSEVLHLEGNIFSTLESSINDISKNAISIIQGFIPSLMNATINVANNIINFLTGLIIAWYILSEKSKVKSFTKKIINKIGLSNNSQNMLEVWKLSMDKINGFLVGKILDSLIVGIICFIFMLIFKMDYAILISFIIGLTNIIPFFGPFIGAIPSIFILLISNPLQALIFSIFILILQQIDGNIIGPKILGDSVGVSKIGIMFAIIVGGKMFGLLGMIIGVPVLAIVWELISDKFGLKENTPC